MSRIPNWLRKTLGLVGESLTFVGFERLISCRTGFILGYHNLPADVFVEQIEALRGLSIKPLNELVDRMQRGESTAGCLAITVDDGVGNTVRTLSAAALERGWPITFFLPTQYLDDRKSAIHMLWTNISNHLPLGTYRFPLEHSF